MKVSRIAICPARLRLMSSPNLSTNRSAPSVRKSSKYVSFDEVYEGQQSPLAIGDAEHRWCVPLAGCGRVSSPKRPDPESCNRQPNANRRLAESVGSGEARILSLARYLRHFREATLLYL